MAIKVQGSTIIDDSRVLINTGNVGVGTTNPDTAVDSGNTGIVHAGIVTANKFYGDGSNLTGISAGQVGALAGFTVREEGSTVGTVGGVGDINFVSSNLTATASGAGATITLTETPEFDNLSVTGVSTFQGNVTFSDSVRAYFGNDEDLTIVHLANQNWIQNNTGDLNIHQNADDSDITFRSDDGSGSITEYINIDGSTGEVVLYHYGSQKLATKSTGIDVTGHTETDTLNVSGVSTFGGAIDLNSSNTNFNDGIKVGRYITGQSGQRLAITNQSNGILLEGGGGASINLAAGGITLGTGTNGPLTIYPSNWTIFNSPTITLDGSNKFANIVGNVGLGSAIPSEKLDVVGTIKTQHLNVTGISTFNSDVRITSTGNLILDASGPQSVIFKDGGSDGLQFSYFTNGDNLNLQRSSDGFKVLRANRDSANIELYHSNSKKLETTNIGIAISNGTADTATITGPSNLVIDPAVVGDNTGSVRIKGDLFVDGTTTQINSTTLEIADFVVGIASTATTDLLTDGAGIQIGPDNTFLYEHNGGTNPSLKSSENLNVAAGKGYQVNQVDVLNATTLGSGVTVSSLTSVGTLNGLSVDGDLSITNKIIHSGDNNTAIRFPVNDTIRLITSGSPRLDVSPNGYILLGTTSEPNGGDAHAQNAKLLVQGRIGNTADSGRINLQRGSSASNDSSIGSINFTDSSNNAFSRIETFADAAPGNSSFPGRITFSTTNDGASTPTEKLRITSDGKVGIGTDNPQEKLHVSGTSDFVVDTDTSALRFGSYGEYDIALVTGRNTPDGSSRLYIENGEGPALWINSDNKVGIGTTDPQSKLDVRGDIHFNNNVLIASSGASNNIDHIWHDDNTSFGRGGTWNFVSDGTKRSTGNSAIQIGYLKSGGGGHFLDSVGIGTTNPEAKLEVRDGSAQGIIIRSNNTQATDTNKALRVRNNSDTNTFHVSHKGQGYFAGDVGIGIDNPAYSLDLGESPSTIRLVSEDGGTALRVGAGGGGNDVTLIRVDGEANNHDGESNSSEFGFSLKYMGSRNGNNNSLSIFSDNQEGTQVEAITVLQDGKVGIGTDVPGGRLHISGTGTQSIRVDTDGTALSIHDHSEFIGFIGNDAGKLFINAGGTEDTLSLKTNGTERLRITRTGRVGIVTDNPLQKLTVYNEAASSTGGILVQNITYAPSEDRPYLIVGTKGWTGATTNWNTFGFQHRIKSNSGGSPRITVDSNSGELLSIMSGGNIGIGITNPDKTLVVKGADSEIVINDTNGSPVLRLRNNGTTGGTFELTSSNDLLFRAGGTTERLRITSDGDITTLSSGITTQTSNVFYENNRRVLEVHGGNTQGWLAVGATRSDTDAYVGGINFINRHGQIDNHRFLGYIRLKSTHVNTNQYGTRVLKGQLEFATKRSSAGISTTTPDMVISPAGDVGIGTDNPTALLHVQNDSVSNTKIIIESTGTNSYPALRIKNDARSYDLGIDGATDALRVYDVTSAEERLHITTDGTIQLSNLSSAYTSGTATRFSLFNDTNNHYGLHVGNAFDLNYNAGGSVASGKGEHVFHTAAQERLRIASDGKVGIGTNDPLGTVHISSGTSGDATLILEADTDNNQEGDNPYIVFRQDGGVNASAIGHGVDSGVDGNGLTIANSISSGFISFATGSSNGYTNATERLRIGSAGQIGLGGANYGTSGQVLTSNGANSAPTWQDASGGSGSGDKISEGNTEAEVVDNGSDGHFKVTTEGTERLRITSGGKVGIGTDDPTAHLQVYRATQFASNPIIQARSNNGSTNELKFEIDGDGDAYFNGSVGIGTIDTNSILQLQSTSTNQNVLSISANNGRPAHIKSPIGSDFNSPFTFFTNNSWGFDVDSNRILKLSSDYKVGIRTDAPISPLDILLDSGAGDPRIRFDEVNDDPFVELNRWTGNVTNYYGIRAKSRLAALALEFANNATTIGNHSYTERLRITSGGRVGINSTAPETGLDIFSDDGILVRTISNAPTNGARIQFSDRGSGDQRGHIIYKHSDNSVSPGTQDGFLIGGNQSPTVVRVEGRALIDGKVGIGTDNPARLLHLHESSSNGTFLSFTNTTTGTTGSDGALIGIQDDESVIISNKENNHIELHTNNTERLRIASDGKLSIKGDTANMEYLRMGGNNDRGLRFTSSSGSSSVGVVHTINAPGDNGAQGAIVLQTNSAERLRITSDGVIRLSNLSSAYTSGTATRFSLYNDTNNHYGLHVGGSFDLNYNAGGTVLGGRGEHRFHTGGSERLRITGVGTVRIPDNGKFTAGANDDLQIYHSPNDSYIDNTSGSLYIRGANGNHIRIQARSGEESIVAAANGTVELYYDNTPRLQTTNVGVGITGLLIASSGINAKGAIEFDSTLETYNPSGGSGSDSATDVAIALPSGKRIIGYDDGYIRNLLSWNNGSNIIIGQQNTSKIQGIQLKPGNNAGVGLHYGGTADNLKLETTGYGVTVFGTTQTQQLNVSGVSTLSGNVVASDTLTVGDPSFITGGAPADQGVLSVYGVGKNALIIQTTNNSSSRGIAFRNSGDAYVGYISMENRGNSDADMVFGVDNSNSSTVGAVEERLRITKDGNVGIGTDDPTGKLQVGSATGSHVIITENTGIDINDGAINLYQATSNVNAAPFIISTDVGGTETEKLRVTGAGNVGINSSIPAARLDVHKDFGGIGAGIYAGRIYGTDLGVSETGVRFVTKGTGDLHNVSDAYLMHGISNGTTRFVFGANGKVGIETDNPQTKLDVKQTTQFDISNATASAGILVRGGSTAGQNNYGGAVTLSKIGSSRPGGSIAAVQTTSDPDQMGIAFLTHGSATTNNTVGERVRITAAGKVGINSTAPETGLDVRSDDGIFVRTVSNGPTNGAMIQFSDQGSAGQRGFIRYKHPDNSISPGSHEGFLIGGTENTSVVRVEGRAIIDEKVGVGTDTPTATLHVRGTQNDGGILVEDSSTSTQAPAIKVIGKRSDSNVHHSFSGKLLLAKNQTNAKIQGNDSILGTVAFGGNHTDATMSNILYAASIHGVAEDTFDSATDMPTALVFRTGTTGRSGNTNNVQIGTERLRIKNDGDISIPGNAGDKTIFYGDGSTVGYFQSRTNVNRSGSGQAIHIQDYRWNNTAVARTRALTGDDAVNKDNGVLTFETNSGSGLTERVRISENGNVGISSTVPESTLDVGTGTITTKGSVDMRASDSTTQKFSMLYNETTDSLDFVYTA